MNNLMNDIVLLVCMSIILFFGFIIPINWICRKLREKDNDKTNI